MNVKTVLPAAHKFTRNLLRILSVMVVMFLAASSHAGESRIEFDFSKATPRNVEEATQHSITRDYEKAWQALTDALSSNSPSLLDAYFVGPAKNALAGRVASQRKSDLSSHYRNQSHKLQAVFYAPEGDVMVLHDTAELDLEVWSGERSIHSEHLDLHYVVVMTPAADRWVVRQLQQVMQF